MTRLTHLTLAGLAVAAAVLVYFTPLASAEDDDFDMAWAAVMSSASKVELQPNAGGAASSIPQEGATGSGSHRSSGGSSKRASKAKASSSSGSETTLRALYDAAFQGNIKKVRHILDAGVDINSALTMFDESTVTALHAAAFNGHPDVVDLLVSAGADVNARTSDGATPLYTAIQNGHINVAKRLIKLGADVNAKRDNGWTAIQLAVDAGNSAAVKLLIDNGATCDDNLLAGGTVVFNAAMHGHRDILRILGNAGVDFNRPRPDNQATPFHAAALNGHKNIGEIVLRFGGDPNARMQDGVTPLQIGAEYGHYDFVEWLVSVPGIDLNAQTDKGQSARDMATIRSHKEVLELLKAHGAKGGAKRLILPVTKEEAFRNTVKSIFIAVTMLVGPLAAMKLTRTTFVEPRRRKIAEEAYRGKKRN